jgi:hypothetical protein
VPRIFIIIQSIISKGNIDIDICDTGHQIESFYVDFLCFFVVAQVVLNIGHPEEKFRNGMLFKHALIPLSMRLWVPALRAA